MPQFNRLWGAGACSGLGAEIGELALPSLALLTLGATAAEASWVRAALLAPFLLLTLWLGVLVDRCRRRPLMLVADIGRGAILALVCVLALFDRLGVPALIVATFGLGTLTVLYQLADFSFVPHIVPERHLIDANAKITATQSAISITGTGVGGTLVQLLTAPFAVAANALGYLASATLIGRIRVHEERPARAGRGRVVAEARAGLRVLRRHRVLRALVAEASVWNLGNEILMLALAVHVLDGAAAGPLVLGIILTCGGAGSFIGSLCSSRLTARHGYGPSLLASLVLGNSAPFLGVLVVLGGPPAVEVPVLCAAFLASGAGSGVANSQSSSIRQLAVPGELRGRVNAGYRLLSWGALSIGALAGGLLTTAAGPLRAAALGALVMAAATLPVLWSPVRRVRAIQDVAAGSTQPG
ncbi:MFS transporter [Streptomyces sp. MAR4 CNX-425]|uniref:MFS transporter n=1 Tax=Streptomyces sp. MAR4 CNX-425 TaxID=3406343 RepID=UPI003B510D3D